MSTSTEAPEEAGDLEVVSTRVFHAPRDVLFRAFTDPGLLAQWWGPEGFTSTFQEFDPRPGAVWRFVMHGPDGVQYAMENHFIEVAPGERIVLRHVQAGHGFRMTMTYADEAGGTRLTWRMRFESAEDFENVKHLVAAANEQNFDRLAAQLGPR